MYLGLQELTYNLEIQNKFEIINEKYKFVDKFPFTEFVKELVSVIYQIKFPQI